MAADPRGMSESQLALYTQEYIQQQAQQRAADQLAHDAYMHNAQVVESQQQWSLEHGGVVKSGSTTQVGSVSPLTLAQQEQQKAIAAYGNNPLPSDQSYAGRYASQVESPVELTPASIQYLQSNPFVSQQDPSIGTISPDSGMAWSGTGWTQPSNIKVQTPSPQMFDAGQALQLGETGNTRTSPSTTQSMQQPKGGDAVDIVNEIYRTGGNPDPTLLARAREEMGMPIDSRIDMMAGRNTVPVRSDGDMVYDPITGRTNFVPSTSRYTDIPSEGMFYKSAEHSGVYIPGQSIMDTVSGEVITSQKVREGSMLENIAGSGSPWTAQSGTVSTKRNAAVIRNQDWAIYPEGDERGINLDLSVSNWREVNANWENTSAPGDNLYGMIGGQSLDGRVLDSRQLSGADWFTKEIASREAAAKANTQSNPTLFTGTIPFTGLILGGVAQASMRAPKDSGNLVNFVTPEGMDYMKGGSQSVKPNSGLIDYGYKSDNVLTDRHVGYERTEPTTLTIRPDPVARYTNPFWAITTDVVKIGGLVERPNPAFIEGVSNPKNVARTILVRESDTTIAGGDKIFPAILGDTKYGLAYGSTVSQQTKDQKAESWRKDLLYNANVKERVADKTRELNSYTERWDDVQAWTTIPNPDPYAGKVKPNVAGTSEGGDLLPRTDFSSPASFLSFDDGTTVKGGTYYNPFNVEGTVQKTSPYVGWNAGANSGGSAFTPSNGVEPIQQPSFGQGVAVFTTVVGGAKAFVDGFTQPKITDSPAGGNKTISDMRGWITNQTPIMADRYNEISNLSKGNVTNGNWTGTEAGYKDVSAKINTYTSDNKKFNDTINVYNAMDAQNPSMVQSPQPIDRNYIGEAFDVTKGFVDRNPLLKMGAGVVGSVGYASAGGFGVGTGTTLGTEGMLASNPVGWGVAGGLLTVWGMEASGRLGLTGNTKDYSVRSFGADVGRWAYTAGANYQQSWNNRIAQEKNTAYIGSELPVQNRKQNELSYTPPVSELPASKPSIIEVRGNTNPQTELPMNRWSGIELPAYIPTNPFINKNPVNNDYGNKNPNSNPNRNIYEYPTGYPTSYPNPLKTPTRNPLQNPYDTPFKNPFNPANPLKTPNANPNTNPYTNPFQTTFPNPTMPGKGIPKIDIPRNINPFNFDFRPGSSQPSGGGNRGRGAHREVIGIRSSLQEFFGRKRRR